MFEDLLRLKDGVDQFLREARALLNEVKKTCEEMRAESKVLTERITELHGAHETVLGWLSDIDEDAEHEVAVVTAEAAATASEAAAVAVGAAATVEQAAATVAEAVEEHLPEEPVNTETPPANPPAETPPAETPPTTPPAETPPAATPPAATPPEKQRKRTLI